MLISRLFLVVPSVVLVLAIQIKILASNFHMDLVADKGKSFAELQEKIFQSFQQRHFQLSFSNVRTDGQEIQVIGIFENLVGKIGLGCWKCIRKISNRLALSVKGITSSLSKRSWTFSQAFNLDFLFHLLLKMPGTEEYM